MNRNAISMVVALLCANALTTIHAAEKHNALMVFTDAARSVYDICHANSVGDVRQGRACIAKEKDGVRLKFEAAQSVVSKNKVATGMLRDFYAFWRATFEDIPARTDETKLLYDKRTWDATAAINEKATRLELELLP